MGWSHHDAPAAIDWVVEHVDDQSERQGIYQRLIAVKTDVIMDLMLDRHGRQDYETMMLAIAHSDGQLLNIAQRKRFFKMNQSKELEDAARKNWESIVGLSGQLKPAGLENVIPLYESLESVLIIPRR